MSGTASRLKLVSHLTAVVRTMEDYLFGPRVLDWEEVHGRKLTDREFLLIFHQAVMDSPKMQQEKLEPYPNAVERGWEPPGIKRAVRRPIPGAPDDETRMPIPDYPDYEIDRNGRVWSKERYTRGGPIGRFLPGRFMTPFTVNDCGPYYSLSNDYGKRTISIERLLAVTWRKK